MANRLSLQYSFDLLFALLAVAGVLATLQSFIIGRHYIIPTEILAATLLVGNIAWYGLQDRPWAKYVLFWFGTLLTCHAFFALFFSKAYPKILGAAFEPVCVVVVLVFGFLVVQYARRNALFRTASG